MKNLFDSFLKDNYAYDITKATLEEDTGILTLETRINFVLPYEGLIRTKEAIKDAIGGIRDVKFQFSYEHMVPGEEEIIETFMDYMVAGADKKCGAFARSIKRNDYRLEEGRLIIFVLGEKGAQMLNEKTGARFSAMLEESFGIKRQVIFMNHREEVEKTIQEVNQSLTDAPVPAERPAKARKNGAPAKGITGKRLLGRPIKGERIPMAEVSEAGDSVVVEGEIFRIDQRTIKSGKKLITLLFTDGTTSMCGKFFTAEEKWEAMKDILTKGTVVRVAGNVEWDSFSNTLVLMIKAMEKGVKLERQDDAPVKRVELHAHTKMSSMDGLNEVADLVGQAAKWGQEAVAITDHGVVQAFPAAAEAAAKSAKAGREIKIIYGLEGYYLDDRDCVAEDGTIDYKKKPTNHIILLAQNQEGLKNLYKLVSLSHLEYFYKRPRIPRSVLEAHREGLIIGSACEAGEVFRAITAGKSTEELLEIADFYDYLEIQPIANNQFMIQKGMAKDEEELRDFNRKVLELGDALGKPVVATCDAHYNSPEDAVYRNILMAGQGYDDVGGSQGLYLRTTEEMLAEFDYLPPEVAHRVVVENPSMIAATIQTMKPVPSAKFPPKIPDSDKILRETCEKNAAERYGDPLPEKIRERLDKELSSIIGNGYAVMYVSAKMLVEKSMEDGFLVGSRGSVGSSFAATMSGITEVNPLPPHYICPSCKYLEWGDEMEFDCGVDMPEKNCPVCGASLDQDGFSIPFETFLGFKGDKEPDIDLNFAGEYQATAHKYVDEIFGAKNVYKAGTIGTIADKTAYGFVMKYHEEIGQPVNKYEAERLTEGCTGVRRTTGQHPGGIIIVPDDHDIHEFCPVQRPANDMKSDIITTHFDYHSIDENLLKLDILGHDVPSMIRQLQDITGVDPQKVPLKDQRVTGIFNGVKGLAILDPDYPYTHGSYGIPEFGTRFVRQMLDDTKPDKFADLVRISGFSHGTDVWLNNAQEFIRSGEATMREAISTRDDIMNYLILKGLPHVDAFSIMEQVRRGNGLKEDQEALMIENDVPQWYIESCKRIKYMFPRAHAVAYVMMAYRIAYYKVYYPVAFYAAYLTTKIMDFNWDVIRKGSGAIRERIGAIESKGRNATKKEQDEVIVLEVAYEMFARGHEFLPPDLEVSKAMQFTVSEGKVRVPLCALSGVGETVGRAMEAERGRQPFATVEDLQSRTKVNKTALESLRGSGLLEGLPESDQLQLF